MIDSAKEKIQNEVPEDRGVVATLSDLELALVGGGCGDVLWG
jgi:hypothetical protein